MHCFVDGTKVVELPLLPEDLCTFGLGIRYLFFHHGGTEGTENYFLEKENLRVLRASVVKKTKNTQC